MAVSDAQGKGLQFRGRSSSAARSRPRLTFTPPSVEARWIWGAIVLFVAMSVVWLSRDTRMPDWDSGAHEWYAATSRAMILGLGGNKPVDLFTSYQGGYPPLVSAIGGVVSLVTGITPMAMVLSSNVVFVPLLAFGCFGVGRRAYGPRAGLLAAILALGSPIIVSMFHEYDLDPPQAAMVAMAVWAVLASDRFERLGPCALGGFFAGLAMMTKQTSFVFLAGFVVVALLRAGPRRWRGILLFLIVGGVIALPWYVYHWHDITTSFTNIGGLVPTPFQAPARYSSQNAGWYAWDLLNVQILTPFTIAFVIGLVLAVIRIVRRRVTRDSYEPELVAGFVVSYLAMTFLTHKDPRYSLPMLVFVAVLATGWIGNLSRPRWRTGLTGGVVALATIYFFGMSLGIGGSVSIPTPWGGNNMIMTGHFTLYQTTGWVRGGPERDANVLGLFKRLKSIGVTDVDVNTGADPIDFNTWGTMVDAFDAGLGYGPYGPASHQAYVILRPPPLTTGPKPCQTMNDGSGIYLIQPPAPGLDNTTMTDPSDPTQRYTFLCPGRAPVFEP